jgi:hypothetical protein
MNYFDSFIEKKKCIIVYVKAKREGRMDKILNPNQLRE